MQGWDDLAERGIVRTGVDLSAHTTYKLGGPARHFAEVDDEAELLAIGEAWGDEPQPVLVLGRGSNLLISDSGFDGLVLHLSHQFATIELEDDGMVSAGGALPLPRLARATAKVGRGGLEWCVGVPGSTGGAVRQNAGCFGSEVVNSLIDARVLVLGKPGIETRSPSDLDLGYRHSAVEPHEVVVSARFSTTPVDPETAAEEMREITRWRRHHQPGGTLNAGSVFKNPPGDTAGRIIDELGLKGFAVAGVRVSPRHANFIEAGPEAAAADVKGLIEVVAERVEAATGVRLVPEIQFVGFED